MASFIDLKEGDVFPDVTLRKSPHTMETVTFEQVRAGRPAIFLLHCGIGSVSDFHLKHNAVARYDIEGKVAHFICGGFYSVDCWDKYFLQSSPWTRDDLRHHFWLDCDKRNCMDRRILVSANGKVVSHISGGEVMNSDYTSMLTQMPVLGDLICSTDLSSITDNRRIEERVLRILFEAVRRLATLQENVARKDDQFENLTENNNHLIRGKSNLTRVKHELEDPKGILEAKLAQCDNERKKDAERLKKVERKLARALQKISELEAEKVKFEKETEDLTQNLPIITQEKQARKREIAASRITSKFFHKTKKSSRFLDFVLDLAVKFTGLPSILK